MNTGQTWVPWRASGHRVTAQTAQRSVHTQLLPPRRSWIRTLPFLRSSAASWRSAVSRASPSASCTCRAGAPKRGTRGQGAHVRSSWRRPGRRPLARTLHCTALPQPPAPTHRLPAPGSSWSPAAPRSAWPQSETPAPQSCSRAGAEQRGAVDACGGGCGGARAASCCLRSREARQRMQRRRRQQPIAPGATGALS